MFKKIQSFILFPLNTLWYVVDYFTPESIKFRRIISRVNAQTRMLQRSIDTIDRYLDGVIVMCNNNIHKAETLYQQPNHDLNTMKYYVTQIMTSRERINRLNNVRTRFELFKTQILDQVYNAKLARSLGDVAGILKDINNFNEEMNASFKIEDYNLETLRANETTAALDGAIITAQQDTVVNIETATDGAVATVIAEIANRVQAKQQQHNQNESAIEPIEVTIGTHGVDNDKQLEERFNRLCSSRNE